MPASRGSNDRVATVPMPGIVVTPSALAVEARMMPARRAQTDPRRRTRAAQKRSWRREV